MKRSEIIFGLVRIPLDALAVACALLLSYHLRMAAVDLVPGVQLLEPAQTLPAAEIYRRTFVLPGMMLFVAVASALSLYVLRSTRSAWDEMGRVVIAAMLWLVGVAGWYFLVRRELFFSRVLLMHSVLFIALFVTAARAGVTVVQRVLLVRGVGVRRVVSVGAVAMPASARMALERDRGYHYVGHLPDCAALRRMSTSHPFDLVLQTDPDAGSAATMEVLEECRSHHMGYAFLPPVLADVPHQLRVERLGIVPMLRLQPTPLDGWGRVAKRCFDIVGSIVLITILSPILLGIALAVLIDSGRPVFYLSRRVGEYGRRDVPALKFRSMVPDADARKAALLRHNERADGPLFKVRDDPRITRLGGFLRRFDLDELPQLCNVVLGQMSLVGPRPHLPEEVQRYTPYQRRVFAVKPGMTGLAQISGRSALRFEDEVRHDLRYIEEWSLWLDLWILWRTVFVVIAGKSRG